MDDQNAADETEIVEFHEQEGITEYEHDVTEENEGDIDNENVVEYEENQDGELNSSAEQQNLENSPIYEGEVEQSEIADEYSNSPSGEAHNIEDGETVENQEEGGQGYVEEDVQSVGENSPEGNEPQSPYEEVEAEIQDVAELNSSNEEVQYVADEEVDHEIADAEEVDQEAYGEINENAAEEVEHEVETIDEGNEDQHETYGEEEPVEMDGTEVNEHEIIEGEGLVEETPETVQELELQEDENVVHEDVEDSNDSNQHPGENTSSPDAQHPVEEEGAAPGQDEDYEDAVEEEDAKQDVEQEENVAEHIADSDSEDGDAEESDGVKLGQMSDNDVRDSDEDDATESTEVQDKKETEASEGASQAEIAKMFDSDSEEETEKGEGVGNLIHDIFGESDDENEEFTGFGDEEPAKSAKVTGAISSDSEDDDEPPPSKQQVYDRDDDEQEEEKGTGMVYDFDVMLQKKKAERKGRRRRDGGTMLNDSDDIISAMMVKMKDAADADKEANLNKRPALNKLKMMQTVMLHLKKQDLKEAFVDMGMIAAIADWLSPLPDRSLPHLSIRTELLKVLHDLPSVSPETLKTSGIGRSVMILFKHPRETRQNRESAGRLINKWSRPIFGLNDNFKSMTRGDREQRDLEQMPQAKRRRMSTGQPEGGRDAADPGGEHEPLRPGDKGFVMRARVPKPSYKDYVMRPKWKVEMDDEEGRVPKRSRGKSRKDERLEKHIKTFANRKKNDKQQRAVGISLQGGKMPL